MAKNTGTGDTGGNGGIGTAGGTGDTGGQGGTGRAGDRNSGNWNSGDGNSGDWNSGYWNSGYGNSTNRESGIFNSEQGTLRMFNKPTDKKWEDIDHPHFNEFYTCKWIPWLEMTATEKKENPQAETTEGYLKKFEYKEAWANFWRDTDEANRKKFLALPNFDAQVFKDITGIDVLGNSKKDELIKKAQELLDKAKELQDQANNL